MWERVISRAQQEQEMTHSIEHNKQELEDFYASLEDYTPTVCGFWSRRYSVC